MKHIRKMRNITQKELAKRIGVTQSYISKLEKNQEMVNNLRINRLIKIAECLGICPVALVCTIMHDIKKCGVVFGQESNFEDCYIIKKHLVLFANHKHG